MEGAAFGKMGSQQPFAVQALVQTVGMSGKRDEAAVRDTLANVRYSTGGNEPKIPRAANCVNGCNLFCEARCVDHVSQRFGQLETRL